MTEEIYKYRKLYMMKLIPNLLKRLSDPDYQQKAWVEESIPNIIDSWDEIMCQFFDDAYIDYLLEDLTPESEPELNLSQHQIDALWMFRNKLRVYSHNVYDALREQGKGWADPRIILADPRWHEVVACAKETLKAFDGYQVPPDPVELASLQQT